MDAVKRRSRRAKTPKPFPGRLSPLHLRVLSQLVPYPLLPSHYIHAFVGGRYAWLKTQLRNLVDWGLLEKPDAQNQADNRNGIRAVYRLTDKGFAELKARKLTDAPWRPHREQYAHELLINEVIAGVEIMLLEHPSMRFIPESEIITKDMRFPVEISIELAGNTHRNKTVYQPDGWFGIQYKDGTRTYYCLEINHKGNVRAKNLKDPSHMKKFLSVNELRRSGTFKKYFGDVPVVLLSVQTHESVTENSMALFDEMSTTGSDRYWWTTLETFWSAWHSRLPMDVWNIAWRRVGHPDASFDGGIIERPRGDTSTD